MSRIQTIVAGVDFSDCSANALECAIRLATRHRGVLHVVHVIDQTVLGDLKAVFCKGSGDVEEQVRADMRRQLQAMLDRMAPAIPPEMDVVVGSPLDGLIRKVKAVSADLLVLGTRGQGGSQDTGTLAAKAVRKAPATVLLVEPHHAKPFREVVVCIDFSEVSPRLVELAAEVMQPDGNLTLLHVYSPPWSRLHYKAPTPEASPNYQAEYKLAMQAKLEGYLDKLPPELREKSQMRTVLYESPRPGYGILDFVRQRQADLAVLGTRGRTHLRYMLLGSTSERVVRDTPSSLLAMKPIDFDIQLD